MVAAAVATAICANSYRVGARLGVLDQPDNDRKLHSSAVPMVGGIAILIAACAWFVFMLLTEGVASHKLRLAMIICGAGAGLIGFLDDRNGLAPSRRMFLLFVLAFSALAIDPALIAAKAHWTPSLTMPISPLIFSILFSISAAGVVNAVNMADGQNGIVGAMYIIWIACLLISRGTAISASALMLLPLTIIFLIYNLREKLFLGDCGSYGVTFVLGLLVAAEYAYGRITLMTIIAWFFLPVADCLRLSAARIREGRSPFSADRDHLHHRLEFVLGRNGSLAAYVTTVAAGSVLSTLKPALATPCVLALGLLYAVALAACPSSDAQRTKSETLAGQSLDNSKS